MSIDFNVIECYNMIDKKIKGANMKNKIKLDYNVVVAKISGNKRLLIVTKEYDEEKMVNAYDLHGHIYKVKPYVGEFNVKTGKGWLSYWGYGELLKCAYDIKKIQKQMKNLGINKGEYVSIKTLKEFEDLLNEKKTEEINTL